MKRAWVVFVLCASGVFGGAIAACDAESSVVDRDGDAGADAANLADGASGSDASTDAPREAGAGARALPPGRPSALACQRATPRPPSNAGVDAGLDAGPDAAAYECSVDGDCTAKPDGRCDALESLIWFGTRPLGRRCTYDACKTDGDCGDAGACGCGVGFAGQNLCLPQSACRVDAECTSGNVCAFSRPFIPNDPGLIVDGSERGGGATVPVESLGYFCTSAEDECRPGETPPYPSSGCVYAPMSKHWIWWYQP